MDMASCKIVPSPEECLSPSKMANNSAEAKPEKDRTDEELDKLEVALAEKSRAEALKFTSGGMCQDPTSLGHVNGVGGHRKIPVSTQLESLQSHFKEIQQAESAFRIRQARWLQSVEQWLLQQQDHQQVTDGASFSSIAARGPCNGTNENTGGLSDRHQNAKEPMKTARFEIQESNKTVDSIEFVEEGSNQSEDKDHRLFGLPSQTVDVRGFLKAEQAEEEKNNKAARQSTMDYIMGKSTDVHWVQTMQSDVFFGCWILLNAVGMAVEADWRTDSNDEHFSWLIMDSIFNVVFIAELVLRVRAQGRKWAKECWNILDFLMVLIGVIDSWLIPLLPAGGGGADLRIVTLMRLVRLLKLIRVFRLIRLVSFLKELRFLVLGMIQAFRATIWGLVMLVGIIFMCALLLTKLVGKQCCDEGDLFVTPSLLDYFGSMPKSAFTLFQFTMEFQPDIVRDTWEDGVFLTFFLISYTALTHIMLLNMMSSIIVESILAISKNEDEIESAEKQERINEDQMHRLMDVFEDFDLDKSGTIEQKEFEMVGATKQRKEQIMSTLKQAGITSSQASELFRVLDVDESGSLSKEEFIKGFMRMKGPPLSKHILKVECQMGSLMRTVKYLAKDVTSILDPLALPPLKEPMWGVEKPMPEAQPMPPTPGCADSPRRVVLMPGQSSSGVASGEEVPNDNQSSLESTLAGILGTHDPDERSPTKKANVESTLSRQVSPQDLPYSGLNQPDADAAS